MKTVELLANDLIDLDFGLLEDVPGGPSEWAGLLMSQGDVQEMRALLEKPPKRESATAVVFLPGIMGSLLSSTRGIGGPLWLNGTVLVQGRINLLDLDETGESDASPDVNIIPTGIEKSTYVPLAVYLSRACCLYEFPYDWRKRLETAAAQLADAMRRWSSVRPHQRFTLLGHSMGGMVARTFVTMYPRLAERLVERIILLGSPIYGAALSPQIFTGDNTQVRLLKRLNEANDVVSMCCGFPSCYELLPPPPECFPSGVSYPFNWDIYDARCWNIPGLRQNYLDQAASYHRMMYASDPQIEMWQFAGCNIETVVGLTRLENNGHVELDTISAAVGEASGDGTVPLWSARSSQVQHMHYIENSHHNLPSDKQVLQDIASILRGAKPLLPSVVPLPEQARRESLNVRSLTSMANDIIQHVRRGELSALDAKDLLFRGDRVD